MDNSNRNYYNVVTIFGMMLCVIWIIAVNTQPFSDFNYYSELAKKIAAGGQWGDTYTSVGYSIILGFIYSIFGSSLIIAKIFNLVLTFFNYTILYNLLKRVDLSETRRKIIYTIFVFFPVNIFYNSILGSEILFTTILLMITLVYYSNFKAKYVFIGILTGINSMMKPFFIIFFLAIFIIELLLKINFIKVIKHTITIFLVSILCISPWVYRNTKLMRQFTFISNNGGIVLYINNNSQNNYGRWMSPEKIQDSVVLKKEYIMANRTQKNKLLTTSAEKWILNHPLHFIELGFKRIFNTYFIANDIFFSLNGVNLNRSFQLLIIIYTFLIKAIVFVPAIIYIIVHSKTTISNLFNKKSVNSYDLYSLTCFYMFTCVYFITEGQGRYSFPLTFLVIYFFSFVVEKLNIECKYQKVSIQNGM